MKKHIIIGSIAFLLFALLLPQKSEAQSISGASAKLVPSMVKDVDNREKVLTAYLKKHNSPLVPHAHTFIEQADKYDLDWKLLPAIAGVESTFGKHIPYNSYNGWGWGIYGTNSHSFTSWDDAISTISSELRSRYMDRWGARDVYQIGKYYAASPTWPQKVTYFMNAIDEYEEDMQNTSLSISL